MGKRVPRDLGGGGEHSGGFGFVRELIGGELRLARAVAVMSEGGSRGKKRERPGHFWPWASVSAWAE
jgi:hypothetical protein